LSKEKKRNLYNYFIALNVKNFTSLKVKPESNITKSICNKTVIEKEVFIDLKNKNKETMRP
jgi:hypothetical protein